jgi:penicillin-binding protein 2
MTIYDFKDFSIRLQILTLIFLGIFLLLARELWDLQINQGAYYRELSLKNRIRILHLPAPRGRILDRNGELLADNRPRFDLVATKEDIDSLKSVSKILSSILNVSEKEIVQKFFDGTAPLPYEPATVATDLSLEKMMQVSENLHRLPGITLRTVPIRHYPQGMLACHLLGYTGKNFKNSKEPFHENPNEQIGRTGVEKTFEMLLRGIPGGQQIQVNSRGHLDQVLGEKPSIPGADVYLTLDIKIQKVLEEAYGDYAGAAIVLEVATGDVLALLSRPGFDPNDFVSRNNKKISHYLQDPSSPLLNKAISSQCAPGSIFKPIVALAGLKYGHVTDKTSVHCSGKFKLGQTTFACWKTWGHEEVNLLKSLEQSCNVFYYLLGKEMGSGPIVEMASAFHLGIPTGIPLSSEKSGLLPTPEWKKKIFKNAELQSWHLGDTINLSIGQGALLVTPIQMVCMTAAFASQGRFPKPHLLLDTENTKNSLLEKKRNFSEIPLTPKDIALVRLGLFQVMNAAHGSGRFASLEGVSAAGKTGTAQVRGPQGEFKNTWFICFAPFETPKIAIAILVEKGISGGESAAPIAKKIMASYFDLPIKSKDAP